MRPINERLPLIVVKRCYFDEFLSGAKTIEFRRHKGQFTMRVYYPGRRVRIAYNYDLSRFPWLPATVTRFEVEPAGAHPDVMEFYKGLLPHAEIALIHLRIERAKS